MKSIILLSILVGAFSYADTKIDSLSKGDLFLCYEKDSPFPSSRIEITENPGNRKLNFVYYRDVISTEGWQLSLSYATGLIHNNDQMVAHGLDKVVGKGSLTRNEIILDSVATDLKKKTCVK